MERPILLGDMVKVKANKIISIKNDIKAIFDKRSSC